MNQKARALHESAIANSILYKIFNEMELFG